MFRTDLTLWRPAAFGDFGNKMPKCCLTLMLYRPGKSLKRRNKSSSLHSKKYFLLGGAFFL